MIYNYDIVVYTPCFQPVVVYCGPFFLGTSILLLDFTEHGRLPLHRVCGIAKAWASFPPSE